MVTLFLPSFLNPVKAEQEKGPRLRPGRRSKLMKTEKRRPEKEPRRRVEKCLQEGSGSGCEGDVN